MEYTVGMQLLWVPARKWEAPQFVTVDELRSRGHAKLSNGWVVDPDGFAEGTGRIHGGRVQPQTNTPACGLSSRA